MKNQKFSQQYPYLNWWLNNEGYMQLGYNDYEDEFSLNLTSYSDLKWESSDVEDALETV